MFKKFKAILNKDGHDYSKGLIDPFEFHKTFYTVVTYFRVADIDNNQKTSWLSLPAVIFLSGFITVSLLFISFCHGVNTFDIPHITEAGAYFMIMSYELLILSCTKRNVPQYHNLLRAMKADFHYICTKGEKYRKRYFEVQLFTWKICVIVCIFTVNVATAIILFSASWLILFLLTHKPGDEGNRPLLFPLWLPNIDLAETPYYEMAFFFANFAVLLHSFNYTFLLQTQVSWIRHIASKADIIIWSIEDLLEGVNPPTNEKESKYFSKLIMERMRNIVIHHQEMLRVMEDYATVYKKLLMFEQKCWGPLICLTAYCTVQKMNKGELQPILALLCIGTIIVYFIPSYSCTYLAHKVRSISDACWNTPFWIAGPVIRPYFVLIMQRSMRPVPLAAPGFESITLETFSQKMASAYSMFNMLRQIDL